MKIAHPKKAPVVAPTEGAQQTRVAEDEPPPLVEIDSDDDSDDEEDEQELEQEAQTSRAPIPATTTSQLPHWMKDYHTLHTQAQHPVFISQEDHQPTFDAPADTPAFNTRSKQSTPTITQAALLSCIQMNQIELDPQKTAARKYPLKALCEMAGAVLDGTTGKLLEYRHLIRRPEYQEVWGNAFGKEIGRLAQGLPGIVDGTDTIDFITKGEVPNDRFKDCTYARIVTNYRPEKTDPNRIRITVGGNQINYPGDCGTPTADLLTVKLLLNSVISTEGAKFMTLDIANFYLCTPLPRKEYLKMKLADFPDAVIAHYDL